MENKESCIMPECPYCPACMFGVTEASDPDGDEDYGLWYCLLQEKFV